MEINAAMDGQDTFDEVDQTVPSTPATRRSKWSLTQDAFDSLLAALGENRDAAAEQYLQIRTNLCKFFEWRGCSFPDDHADETLNRVAKRIAAGEEVRNPASYAIGVARLLLLEIIKDRKKEESALRETSLEQESSSSSNESEERLECLRKCLAHLSPDNRSLIVDYYQGEKSDKISNRKKLGERLAIPINSLRMRALRLRERLQSCVEECMH
jgi:RNA polymerase sigma factor (sigma-70 family)